MKRFLLLLLVLSLQTALAQKEDRKVIFELRTKCMQLAKELCTENGQSAESFYNVKTNRCYAICKFVNVKEGQAGVMLYDVQTGKLLANTIVLLSSYKGEFKESTGWIGESLAGLEAASAYIDKMTTEPSEEK